MRSFLLGAKTYVRDPLYDAEVEYLESTGTQWIDTGLVVSPQSSFEIDFALTAYQQEKGIFGARSFPRFCMIFAGNLLRVDLNDGSSIRWRQSDSRRTVSYNRGDRFVSDSVYGDVPWDDGDPTMDSPCSDTATVFVDKLDGGISSLSRLTSMKLYGLRIVGDQSCDLVPVRKNGIGYMYDRVSRKLLGNLGTGAFIIGPDKEVA